MIRWLLRRFGYYHIDYGFSCGRHWMTIDGKTIAQTSGDDIWLRDEDVNDLVVGIVGREHWQPSSFRDLREAEQQQMWQRCADCGEPLKWHCYKVEPEPRCPNIDAKRTHRGWLEQRFKSPGALGVCHPPEGKS